MERYASKSPVRGRSPGRQRQYSPITRNSRRRSPLPFSPRRAYSPPRREAFRDSRSPLPRERPRSPAYKPQRRSPSPPRFQDTRPYRDIPRIRQRSRSPLHQSPLPSRYRTYSPQQRSPRDLSLYPQRASGMDGRRPHSPRFRHASRERKQDFTSQYASPVRRPASPLPTRITGQVPRDLSPYSMRAARTLAGGQVSSSQATRSGAYQPLHREFSGYPARNEDSRLYMDQPQHQRRVDTQRDLSPYSIRRRATMQQEASRQNGSRDGQDRQRGNENY